MVQQFNKAKISITLDNDVHAAVSELADKDGRSVSSMINKILREFAVDKKKEDRG